MMKTETRNKLVVQQRKPRFQWLRPDDRWCRSWKAPCAADVFPAIDPLSGQGYDCSEGDGFVVLVGFEVESGGESRMWETKTGWQDRQRR